MSRMAVISLLLAVLSGCSGDAEEPEASGGRPVVFTTFYPTTYLTERIGGDLVEVVCPVPPDEDAIFWKPSAETINRYQDADLIVINGAQFEKWVLTASLPPRLVVDTARPFEDEWIEFEDAVTHAHGPAGEHAHEGVDGHTWLDPMQAMAQAYEIAKGLRRILPERTAAIDEALTELDADLAALDISLRAAREGYDDHAILASHPAYNYVARRYGLKIVNLDLDPEAMPDDETFEGIAEAARTTDARHILWESEPLPAIVKRLRDELGVESILFSPCELMDPADLEAGEDYLSVMRANVNRLKPALRPRGE